MPYRAWQALRNTAGLHLLTVLDKRGVRAQLGLKGRESLRPLVRLAKR